jgi:glycosyltransferase involved in cell wall biosynthesis
MHSRARGVLVSTTVHSSAKINREASMNMSGQEVKRSVAIAACMMVKNEEKHLSQCLDSIKDLVDEIIIVDTGSTDRTIEIARSYGASVYEHPWENDFSKHRNQSINYCTKDWIFVIDADEELCFPKGSTVSRFKEWLSRVPSNRDAVAIPLHDMQQGAVALKMNTARFFRKGKIQYQGTVHNQPQIEGVGLFYPLIHLNHYGYDLSPEKMDAKELRTKTLLLKRIEDDPKDYTAYFYLCELVATRENPEEAVIYGDKYCEHKKDMGEEFNPCVYYTLFHNHLKLGNVHRAEELLRDAMKDLPDDMDIAYALVEFGVVTKNKDKIFVGCRKFLKLYNEYLRNPGISHGRFLFTASKESLSYILFNLSTIGISEGFESLRQFEDVLPSVKKEFRDCVIRDLKKFLNRYGMEMDIIFPEENGIITSVGLPSEEILKQLEV